MYIVQVYTQLCVFMDTPRFLAKAQGFSEKSLASVVKSRCSVLFVNCFFKSLKLKSLGLQALKIPVEIHGHISVGSVTEKKFLKSCMGSCMRSYVLLQQYGTKMEPGKGAK